MQISGWAFKSNEKELANKNSDRYKEISSLLKDIKFDKCPSYGKGIFEGVLDSEEAKKLSEFDIALLMDHGNLCYGGYCTKSGNKFSGAYYTD